MSAPEVRPDFEELLGGLEKTIAELADGTGPLEQLVASHQRALRLLAEAQVRLGELRARADKTAQLLSD